MGLRLFAALVPPPDVLDHAQRALDQVRSGPVDALRWVPRENLHVTIAFYGDVPAGAVPDVTEALVELAARSPAPTCRLSGAGSFGGRTLWLGVAGDDGGRALAGLMQGAGGMLDEDGTDRAQRPHLTVARSGRRARGVDLDDAVQALAVYRGPSWQPRRLVLLSSWLGEGRAGSPRYEVEAVADLAGPADGGDGDGGGGPCD